MVVQNYGLKRNFQALTQKNNADFNENTDNQGNVRATASASSKQ